MATRPLQFAVWIRRPRLKAQSDWRADLLECDGELTYLRVWGDLMVILHGMGK